MTIYQGDEYLWSYCFMNNLYILQYLEVCSPYVQISGRKIYFYNFAFDCFMVKIKILKKNTRYIWAKLLLEIVVH